MIAKQTKITRSARGESCTVRIFEVCNHNPETTVLAHLNGGGGGMKNPDYLGAYSCSDCHMWLDGGYANKGATRQERDLIHANAIFHTQMILVDKGLLIIK